jgi:lysophospholipase L1-like esterase
MTVGGRFLSRLVTMLVALVGLVVVGAVPAVAESNPNAIEYVALGDSYAAGQGGGSYLNTCLESPNGYPYVLDPKRRIDLQANVACTGASTSTVLSTQLWALNEDTDLVTLTVGAADLNLSDVLAACTTGTREACLLAIGTAIGLLDDVGDSLPDLYAAVDAKAPNALIVVTGYPYLFDVAPDCDQNASIMAQINCATAALNSTIEQTVLAADAGINIVYVDVTEEFAGHGIGSEEPFINSESDPIGAYHPNAAGYRAYAKAIFAAVRSASLDDKKQAA